MAKQNNEKTPSHEGDLRKNLERVMKEHRSQRLPNNTSLTHVIAEAIADAHCDDSNDRREISHALRNALKYQVEPPGDKLEDMAELAVYRIVADILARRLNESRTKESIVDKTRDNLRENLENVLYEYRGQDLETSTGLVHAMAEAIADAHCDDSNNQRKIGNKLRNILKYTIRPGSRLEDRAELSVYKIVANILADRLKIKEVPADETQ